MYASKKAESVRTLTRTSAPIHHAGGKFAPIAPKEIIAGFLALTANGKQAAISSKFIDELKKLSPDKRIDLACVLERGAVSLNLPENGPLEIQVFQKEQALINFFLSLLFKLQTVASVPAMDIKAYWASLTP